MNRYRPSATWLGTVLGTVCALLVLALGAHAADHHGAYTEEFHQTYALSPDGRIELDNINGAVHISSWDRNEVKVDAIKYADNKDRLDEAKIEIDASKDLVAIKTKYRDHDLNFNWGSHNNPAGVEYTLTVPRTARLDEIKLASAAKLLLPASMDGSKRKIFPDVLIFRRLMDASKRTSISWAHIPWN
jgi:hypothetical protein